MNMINEEYYVENYNPTKEREWDQFIEKSAVNGTFLQTRRFLNYHPSKRFKDASYIVYDIKGKIVAICPACEILEDNKKVFVSHKGSTYGGIIISKKCYSSKKVIDIIEKLEKKIEEDGFNVIQYKLTPRLFSQEDDDLLRYCLYYKKYTEYSELNLYVNLNEYKDNILSHFSQGKRTNVHNCIRSGMEIRSIHDKTEINLFYEILCETLEKYGAKPVHSVEELLDFINNRLTNNCEIYGAYLNNELIAGSMMFYFNEVGVAHTQYLCAKHDYDKLSPMSFMYYSMIVKMIEKNFKYLSWGIVTEDMGNGLNEGLCYSKESFGSDYCINYIFIKNIE